MSDINIIGISGYRNSGKGTLARIFQEHGYVKMSYATSLKDIVSTMFSWPRHLLEGDTDSSREWRTIPDPQWECLSGKGIFSDDIAITPLVALQRIGTDLMRNHVHKDFWTTLLLKRVSEYRGTSCRGIVIDDARFLNELSICTHTICIQRYEYTDEQVKDMHPSETEHLKHTFEYSIDNKGSVEDLRVTAMDLFGHMFSPEN